MFSAASLIPGCSLMETGRWQGEIHVCNEITKLFNSFHRSASVTSKTQERGKKDGPKGRVQKVQDHNFQWKSRLLSASADNKPSGQSI